VGAPRFAPQCLSGVEKNFLTCSALQAVVGQKGRRRSPVRLLQHDSFARLETQSHNLWDNFLRRGIGAASRMRLRQVLSLFAIVDCPAQPSSQRRLYVESFGPISFASSNCFPLISGVVSELADCSWPRLFLQHAYPHRFFKCCEQFLFLTPHDCLERLDCKFQRSPAP